MRTPHLILVIAATLLVGASTAHAALSTEGCVAKKRQTRGKFQQCLANEDAKALQGKPADLGKCSTKLTEKIAALNEKASEAGIGCRFVDNGDGTVTDYDTGLQWEKKVSPGGGTSDPHDVDNTYVWTDASFGTIPDGDAFTEFLAQLNNCTYTTGIVLNLTGFAGHCDWRLPTFGELFALLAGPFVCPAPCIDPIFGPTAASGRAYHSYSTNTNDATEAWAVDFTNGNYHSDGKAFAHHFRAVRNAF